MSEIIEVGKGAFNFAFWLWMMSIPINLIALSFGISPFSPFGVTPQSFASAASQLNSTSAWIGGYWNPWYGMESFMAIFSAIAGIIAGIPVAFASLASFANNSILYAAAWIFGSILQASAWIYLWTFLTGRSR